MQNDLAGGHLADTVVCRTDVRAALVPVHVLDDVHRGGKLFLTCKGKIETDEKKNQVHLKIQPKSPKKKPLSKPLTVGQQVVLPGPRDVGHRISGGRALEPHRRTLPHLQVTTGRHVGDLGWH